MVHFQTHSAPKSPTNMRGGSQKIPECRLRAVVRGSPANRGARLATTGLRENAERESNLLGDGDEGFLIPNEEPCERIGEERRSFMRRAAPTAGDEADGRMVAYMVMLFAGGGAKMASHAGDGRQEAFGCCVYDIS